MQILGIKFEICPSTERNWLSLNIPIPQAGRSLSLDRSFSSVFAVSVALDKSLNVLILSFLMVMVAT